MDRAIGTNRNDNLYGAPLDHRINGGPGNDFIFGEVGDDRIEGGPGNDLIFGLEGDDLIDGGSGDDYLRGHEGNDRLFGRSGDDYLDGSEGDDLLNGGSGYDRVSYAVGATTGVTVDLNLVGVAQDTGRGTDTLIGIEHVTGTVFDDVITGDDGDNWIWSGTDGEGDFLAGNDTLSGRGGDDLIEVGPGNHTLSGGDGIDTLSFAHGHWDNGPNGVVFSLQLQGASQDTGRGMMTASGFENLSGSIYGDVLIGDRGNNLLAGDDGNDLLVGGEGDDTLYGDGFIKVTGGLFLGSSGPITTFSDSPEPTYDLSAFSDVLDGGSGKDLLNGGVGDDILTGGAGRDIFVIGAFSGNDRVTDFTNGTDHLRFESGTGVDSFSDLVVTAVGNDVLISWGDGSSSALLEGATVSQIGSPDLLFG